ncbi:MAG: hypothetical protein JW820_12515, partial [Spirochaetales bacterium]|nr:hypothetical protein [Spirochaetales bacterium]
AGYRVYRSRADGGARRAVRKEPAPVAELGRQATSWTDREAERGVAYQYALTAVDSSGNESEPCSQVEITPTDILPPAPPGELKAAVVRRGMRLSWTACPEPDVKGYRVYRSEYPGGAAKRPVGVVYDKTEFLDRGGSAGLVYAVATIDTSGNEGPRAEVTAP